MNNMTRTKLNELMKTYNIVPSELEDVVAFVEDFLYVKAREIEKEEPYATRAIDRLYGASFEVGCLLDAIEEE
jgi:hypothetical protein